MVKVVNEVPLTEEIPKGFMSVRKGKRSMEWRDDQPATLVWTEALDAGDAEKEVAYRDEVFQQKAPFTQAPQSLLKTIGRYRFIWWGKEDMAIAYDYWWNTRNTKSYVFNPKDNTQKPEIIFDRNYQDRYNDPGSFLSRRNKYGRNVLDINGEEAYLRGAGYTKEGQFPFVDKINLKTQEKERVYQSAYTDKLESLLFPINMQKGEFLVRIESPDEYPNFYIRDIYKKDKITQITDFPNPFKSLQDVHKEVITYKRDDGVELSGTLYLPVGYDKSKKGENAYDTLGISD